MWHVTPEFVIELKSASDRVQTLRAKMQEWIDNGVALGWLILPESRTVEVYKPGSVDVMTGLDNIAGEAPVEGFVLRLGKIWP